jgi:hypothetical protein
MALVFDANPPNSLGIEPDNSLEPNCISNNDVNNPRSLGIEPVSSLSPSVFDKIKETIFRAMNKE